MKTRLFVAVFAFGSVQALVGCKESMWGGGGPEDPSAHLIRDSAVVSGPLSGSLGAIRAATVGDSQLAYVSLPPGSLPEGDSVQIVGGSVAGAPYASARMANGGFDPVPVYTRALDSLPVTVFAGRRRIGPVNIGVPHQRPPTVIRTVPPRGRTDVALNQLIVVVFSQPIDPASITPGTVRLALNGSPVAGTLSVLPDQPWVVRFTPDAFLQPRSAYAIQLASGIVDATGDSLRAVEDIGFITGDSLANVASISVLALGRYSPTRNSIAVVSPGGTAALVAFRVSASGDTLTGAGFAWSSGNASIATVDTAGFVSAHSPGTVTIKACVAPVCGAATVIVGAAAKGVVPREIGDLGSGDSRVYGINNKGQVIGMSRLPPPPIMGAVGCSHAFVWDAASGMRDLGTFGGCNSSATAINDQGAIIGNADLAGPAAWDNFLWTVSTGMRALSPPNNIHSHWQPNAINNLGEIAWGADTGSSVAVVLADGSVSYAPTLAPDMGAVAINDRGDVVINSWTLFADIGGECGTTAWVWNAHTNTIVATLTPQYPDASQPTPICMSDINASGVVLGTVNMNTHATAFRWSAGTGFQFFPAAAPLGTWGISLDDHGDFTMYVEGYRHVGADSLWEANSVVVLASGRQIALGSLGGTHNFANAINDNGIVAGHSQVGSNTGPQHGVIWNINGADVVPARTPAAPRSSP